MSADTPQRAIFDESARYHRFLEYRVTGEIERDRLVRSVATALCAARSSVDRPVRIVVAFGRRLWSALAPDSVPPDLRDFETIHGVDGHVAPATQCDLWLWLQGGGEDENVARTLALHPALRHDFTLQLEQPGFTYFESRDLIGFEDGTANPKDDAARTEAAVVPGGPGAGGCIVLIQRWVHDLGKFGALDVAAQEAVIGRTRAGSIELEGDALAPDSHVARTDVEKDGVAMKVYRRSAPYATLARHGLYFPRLRPCARTPSGPARTDVRRIRRRAPRPPHRILPPRHRKLPVRAGRARPCGSRRLRGVRIRRGRRFGSRRLRRFGIGGVRVHSLRTGGHRLVNDAALPGISVITLGVADVDRSERFYMDGLGLEHAHPPKGVVYFKLAGTRLALFPRDELARYAGVEPATPGGFTGTTLSCNVASASAVDSLTARAEAAGAVVVKAPETVGWGGYCAWIADPDGHLWEIVWNPKWDG